MAQDNGEWSSAYLENRDTLRGQGYSPGEAERLARGLLTGLPDLLLLGVRPGRLDARALARRMGSRFG